MVATGNIQSATIPTGGAAFAVIGRIGRRIAWGARFRGIEVGIERLGFGRGATTFPKGVDLDHTNVTSLRECEHITRSNRGRRLVDFVRVQTHMACADLCGGKRAGFEEPRVPKPFVHAQF